MCAIMSKLKNKFYASTGTLVGRENNFDYNVIIENAKDIKSDGIEFMMLRVWYGKLDEIAKARADAGVYTPVIHFDKDIGVMLAAGDPQTNEKALALFSENARMAKMIGAGKAVFHLWGGQKSDGAVDGAIELLPQMKEICEAAGTELLIENIPCVYNDPLSVWEKIYSRIPDMGFIFDTRFGKFHEQYMDIFASPVWKNVKHMHASSFNGAKNEWGLIRPILQPGEGKVDFDHIISNMPHYEGSVTLESPVIAEDGSVDIATVNRSLDFLRERFEKYRPDEKPV